MLQIPLDLQLRIRNLGTTQLNINVPPGTNVTPQEVITQLYQFVTDIEQGKFDAKDMVGDIPGNTAVSVV